MSSFCVLRVTSEFSFTDLGRKDSSVVFRLGVINVCPVLVPSELLLSSHLPTSEGWTAELTVGLWLVVPTVGLEPRTQDLTRFATLRLNHSALPPLRLVKHDFRAAAHFF